MPDLRAFFPRGVSRVIFDLDGVLADSTPCHRRAFEDLWTELGVDGPPYEEVAGRSTRAVVEEVTAPLSPSEDLIREWAARKQGRAIELLGTAEALFPDVLPVLDALRDMGIPLALGTGASRRRTMELLTGAGIRDRFETVVTADDVRAGKPDPETYRNAVGARLAPSDCLVVEDSRMGLVSAVSAGAGAVSVRTGATIDAPGFLGALADLREIPALVRAKRS